MVMYCIFVTLFSVLMVSFKAGHLKGSKKEKYNIGELIAMIPFVIQLVAGVLVLFFHYKG